MYQSMWILAQFCDLSLTPNIWQINIYSAYMHVGGFYFRLFQMWRKAASASSLFTKFILHSLESKKFPAVFYLAPVQKFMWVRIEIWITKSPQWQLLPWWCPHYPVTFPTAPSHNSKATLWQKKGTESHRVNKTPCSTLHYKGKTSI